MNPQVTEELAARMALARAHAESAEELARRSRVGEIEAVALALVSMAHSLVAVTTLLAAIEAKR